MTKQVYDFEKMVMADGFYCVRHSIVINRSDLHCPAPIGSRLCVSAGGGRPTYEEGVKVVNAKDVVGWMRPGDIVDG